MNINERISQLENELQQLKKEVKKQEVKQKRWRAEKRDTYFCVSNYGDVHEVNEDFDEYDNLRYRSGNYFKTEEEAKNSIFYFVHNSDYFYWHKDMPLPKEQPEEHEYFCESRINWINGSDPICQWNNSNLLRRWKK